MIRLMDAVPMFTWTELNILASGEKTSSTVSVLRHGLTVPSMKATTSMVKSMELVPLSGLTARCTSENFIITIFMEKECTPGQTVASMRESGAITKCTAKELSPGLTAESMSENMLMTRSRVMESSFGLMVAATKVIGKEANSTARECM